MSDIILPINERISVSDIIDHLDLLSRVSGVAPKTGLTKSGLSQTADAFRAILNESSSCIGTTRPSRRRPRTYAERVAPFRMRDVIPAGVMLYLALAKAPGMSPATVTKANLIVNTLRQLVSGTKDILLTQSGSYYETWVKGYANFINSYLTDLGMNVDTLVADFVDKLRRLTGFVENASEPIQEFAKTHDILRSGNPSIEITEIIENSSGSFLPVFLNDEAITALINLRKNMIAAVSKKK